MNEAIQALAAKYHEAWNAYQLARDDFRAQKIDDATFIAAKEAYEVAEQALTDAETAAETQAAIVRSFSIAGPCLTLGELVRQTPRFYIYRTRRSGFTGPDAVWIEKKVAKRTAERYSPAHIEPCMSCQDHPQTAYPEGYQD